MNVNGINLDCFRDIIAKFPLQHVIQLRIVCKQWKAFIEEICSEKTSLKLFGSKTDVLTYCFILVTYSLENNCHYQDEFCLFPFGKDDDLVGGKDRSLSVSCHFLPLLFPNVMKLSICYDNLSHIDVPYLLGEWNQISSLTVRHERQLPKQILTAINSLENLKKLSFLYDDHKEHATQLSFPKVKLSIMSCLEQFVFGAYNCSFPSVARQLGPNIKHLIIGELPLTNGDWKRLFAIKPELGRSLTHLTINSTNLDLPTANPSQLVELICANLPMLTFLDLIDFQQVPLDFMIKQLARLKNLTEVNMYPAGLQRDLEALFKKVPTLPKLNSVKILHVETPDRWFKVSHFYRFFLPLFPNIEELIYHCFEHQLGKEMGSRIKEFSKLKKYSFDVNDRATRSYAFAGRHAKDYQNFLYDKHMGWSHDPTARIFDPNDHPECFVS